MANDNTYLDFVSKFDDFFKQLSESRKNEFINHFIRKTCDQNDLIKVIKLTDTFKTDFVMLLPIEIVEIIFSYLDAFQLSQCCKVNKKEKCFKPHYFYKNLRLVVNGMK